MNFSFALSVSKAVNGLDVREFPGSCFDRRGTNEEFLQPCDDAPDNYIGVSMQRASIPRHEFER